MRSTLRIAAAAFALAPAALSAQSAGRVPRVLELPASTEAMALGDAFMMSASSSDALFYNPALVDGARGFGLDVQSWKGEASAATASAAMAWYGGGVAVGLQTLQYGAPSARATTLPGGQDVLFDLGPASTSERVASVGFAHGVHGVRLGVSGKLIDQRISGDRASTVAVDLGAAARVGPLTLGLTAANLGSALTFPDGDVSLPRRVTLGAGTRSRPVGPLDVAFAAAVTRRDDGEVLAGGGVELGYWPIIGRTFVARVGLQRVPEGGGSPLSLGFAYRGDNIRLEWAYRHFGDTVGAATNRFGIHWAP